MTRCFRFAFLGLVLLVSSQTAVAQESGRHWGFVVAPYLLLPHMNGEMTLGRVESSVEANPGDVFEILQWGFMLYAEAHEELWGVSIDALYMDLSQDGEDLPSQLDAYQGSVEVTSYRRLAPWGEALVGGRLNFLGGSVQLGTPVNRENSIDKVFFDPFVGGRFTWPDTEKWHFSLRADIGGFGVGSDLAWQIYPVVAYRLSDLVCLTAAYRVVSTDYSDDSDGVLFVYDVITFGPELGVAFLF